MKLSKSGLHQTINRVFDLKTLVILAGLSVAVLVVVAFWKLPILQSGSDIYTRLTDQVQAKSQVEIDLDLPDSSGSANLEFRFVIIESDKTKFDDLAKSLNLGSSWPKEVVVGVDYQTAKNLDSLLPLSLNLNLLDRTLTFKNLPIQSLSTSKVANEYVMASGSGKFKLSEAGIKDIDLEIENLGAVMDEASKSGKLYLSPILKELEGVWRNIEKLELIIKGERVAGKVEFRD